MTANTKQKILRTAAREFAENGFRKTTIRSICQKAAVNVAAVNYHFAGKAELYCKTIDWLMETVCAEYKIISKDNPPEQNIRTWVGDCIRERVTGKSWQKELVLQIVHHEMLGPSENYDYIYQTRIVPDLEILGDSIKRGLNREINDEDLKLRVFSLLGLTLFYIVHQNMINKYAGTDFIEKQQDKIIDLIVSSVTADFSS